MVQLQNCGLSVNVIKVQLRYQVLIQTNCTREKYEFPYTQLVMGSIVSLLFFSEN